MVAGKQRFPHTMDIHFTIDQIDQAASNLACQLDGRTVLAFHGQMGAGKTTFISALCRVLGVEDAIASPTYSIINQYRTMGGDTIYHMDWYRLADEEEAIQAGVEDALYSGHLCLVEWPARAAALLPSNTLHLHLAVGDEDSRTLTVFEGGL